MKVLVVGSGAREHALCWKLAQEPNVEVLAAPGNPGIASVAPVFPTAATDVDGLLTLARQRLVDLTVVGPEAPLAAGLVDRFSEAGQLAFGPSSAAARLETSKAFAKAFMQRHGIPTARFAACETADEARRALAAFGQPVVLKADGLAAGKGVVVAEDLGRAHEAIDAFMVARELGSAGDRLVVEEFLQGQEASFFALCDGSRSVAIGTAQDHKRAFDGDQGPNTGGMGAFAPSVLIDDETAAAVECQIVAPVLAGMAAEGYPFRGFLYVGLMLTSEGPKVVEFNVRFGDPEAQVVLPSFAEPLLPWLSAAAQGRLPDGSPARSTECLVGVVMASAGYPARYSTGHPIGGLDALEAHAGVLVFHAGTAIRDGAVVTAGGRVLTIVGRGADYRDAMAHAYAGVARVTFDGCQFRRDIGSKALTACLPPTPSSRSAAG